MDLLSSKILKCHHKNCSHVEFSTLYDYNMHCHNKHPIHHCIQKYLSLIETLGLEAKEILGNNKPKRYINYC